MIKIRLDPTLPDADLSLRLFIGCQDHFNTYVHPAAIVGGTTCPYEQLTPTSPTVSNLQYLFPRFCGTGQRNTFKI